MNSFFIKMYVISLKAQIDLKIEKFQKDLNNNSPHEAIDYIQNSSWKLSVFSV